MQDLPIFSLKVNFSWQNWPSIHKIFTAVQWQDRPFRKYLLFPLAEDHDIRTFEEQKLL